jgi:proline dehydrogenase
METEPKTLNTISSSVSFEDTAVAFSHKSFPELKKSNFLFTLMNNSQLVSMGTFLLSLSLKLRLPVNWLVKATIFEQFCGGEDIEQCQETIDKLGSFNVRAILDYSVEGKDTEESFEATKDEIIRTIQKARNSENIPFCVFKPTGISRLDLMAKVQEGVELSKDEIEEFDRVKQRFYAICSHAAEAEIPILIDAEETWIQDPIDEIVYDLMKQFNQSKTIVYNTYQMYRVDMLDRLKKAFHYAATHNYFLGAKLVRGAYMEKEALRAKEHGYPNPIFETKKGTDDAYNAALKFCIDNKQRVSVLNGSHNEYSNYYLTVLMEKHGMKNNDPRVYFAQLYGMSDNISFNLAQKGYNVVKYVPYGPVINVIPYLMRRAEENTSIAGQTSRELQFLRKEISRRQKEQR